MVPKGVTAGVVLLAALAATPVFADDGQRRSGSRRGERGDGRASASRAVPRSPQAVRAEPGRSRRDVRPQAYRHDDRRAIVQRRHVERRDVDRRYVDRSRVDRRHVDRRYVDRRSVDRRYVDRRRYNTNRYVYSPRYSHRSRYVYAPRIIRPRIVTWAPYRPYVYRPSLSIGVYYGSGGSYPYGDIPRAYYDPVPGRAYGGVRITDAPRDAQVFADGYYVGIVDDFDGVFQHVNLEAGAHRIEVQAPGLEPVAFDVMVQPGRTMTLRADAY